MALETDDDLGAQVKAVLSAPISNAEVAIRQLHISALLLENRISRMEKIALWLGGTIVAASATVIVTVVTASYSLGARMEAFTQVNERVASIESRLARQAP